MTTTWKITQLDRQTSDGFINTAHWTATAVDGDYTAFVYSTCSFATNTPSIPYASVTEQDVLEWCWVNGVDKDKIEATLANNIALQKNPVSASGLPW
jgi:hypothetical protein